MQVQRAGSPRHFDGAAAYRHPALVPLLAGVEIVRDAAAADLPDVHCPVGGRLVVHPRLPNRSSDVTALRYGLELAWLATLPGLGLAAAAILAARTAGWFALLHAIEDDGNVLHGVAASLTTQAADPVRLVAAARILSATHGGGDTLAPGDFAACEALWPLALPTECLLASGGDDRLTLDPATGLNRYGCAPWPCPEVLAFSSCTASSLAPPAFAAAELARRQLIAATHRTAPSAALADASDAIGAALLDHFGVADLADAVLAASGTDAALVVTGLLAAEAPGRKLTSVLVSPSETGSGVPDAVQGRHFASSAAAGCRVGKGQTIEGIGNSPDLVTVALRQASGAPRNMAGILADCDAAIRAGLAAGGHVVLHAIDGSKTGLAAPDRAACARLAAAYGDRLDIVVDACQARVEPALVRWHLRRGSPVLVTGSKFFGAPGFCGAVLFPRARLRRIACDGRLPAGLAPYARLEGGFGSRRCPGLLLRWQAALHHMRAFASLPVAEVRGRLEAIGERVVRTIALDGRLSPVEAPRPRGFGWSGRRSIFTFAVRDADRWLSPAELRVLYHALRDDRSDLVGTGQKALAAQRCQLGQPVELGDAQRGGLRIAISAGQVLEAGEEVHALSVVVGKLSLLLDCGLALDGRAKATGPAAMRGFAGRTLLTG